MNASESGTIAVLAEKPSVARDIARVLGADKRGKGYLQGNGYVVTWAIGHLVSLAEPHQINPQWRQWRLESLPILPDQWPLVVYERSKEQFEVVQKILMSPRVSRIVCATDAGREGELIFRYIYEAAKSEKPFSRLWISSLTPDAIRKGFASLRPGSDYDRLADAACGRSRADWLVGMNLSRAYSIVYNEELSVGRVQTPTLAMIVDRELTLRRFVPEDYLEVVATFQASTATEAYEGTWFRPHSKASEEQGRKQQPIARRWPGSQPDHGAGADRPGRHRDDHLGNGAYAAAAALRPDGTAAACQPPVRLQRAKDARSGAGALRAAQAHQLSTDRQPSPLDRYRGDDAQDRRRSFPAAISSTWLREPASAPWASVMSTTARSAIITPLFPPRLRCSQTGSPMKKARSTTWSAGAC